MKSPFGDKFAVPRQPGLAPAALSEIIFYPPYGDPKAFESLDGFSHLHVIFFFDQIPGEEQFRAMVRPPRLGGNRHVGVFASRSPFRPSRIGLSLVKLEEIRHRQGAVSLMVSGADLVNGTPILDIKPYVPFVDAKAEARGGFAESPPPLKKVDLSEKARLGLADLKSREIEAICQILAQDPRPAYKERRADPKIYKAQLYQKEIAFYVQNDTVLVVDALQSKKNTAKS